MNDISFIFSCLEFFKSDDSLFCLPDFFVDLVLFVFRHDQRIGDYDVCIIFSLGPSFFHRQKGLSFYKHLYIVDSFNNNNIKMKIRKLKNPC